MGKGKKKKSVLTANDCMAEIPCCKGTDRREFLKIMGATSLASLVPPLNALAAEPHIELPLPKAPEGVAFVGIAREESVEETVRAAVELAGGLGDISRGDTVVIKPNIMGPAIIDGVRACTHSEVMGAVIRLVKERTGARNITVAEASPIKWPTRFFARRNGILDECQKERVKFRGWEKGPYSYVTSEHFEYIDYAFRIPTCVALNEFDHFISVPILKNHEVIPNADVEFTCSIKLHVGTMHPFDRLMSRDVDFEDVIQENAELQGFGIHHQYLGEACAELNLAIPGITMNIVDALSPVISRGPCLQGMEDVNAGLILASKDRVACDSLAVAVLKHYALQKGVDKPYVHKSVWDQAQIRRAQELNLGRTREHIIVEHNGFEDIDGILAQWV